MFVKITDEVWVNPEHVVAIEQAWSGAPTKISLVGGVVVETSELSLTQVLNRLGGDPM